MVTHSVQRTLALALAFLAAVVAMLTLATAPAHADEIDTDKYSLSIAGNVTNGDKAISGAQLLVKGPGVDATIKTDAEGKWKIGVPEAGDFEVSLLVNSLPTGVVVTEDPKGNYSLDSAGNGVYKFTTVKNIPSKTVNFYLGQGERVTSSFWSQLVERLVTGVNFGLLLALASIGASLIFGTTGLSNFAHGEMVTFGAVIAVTFTAIGWPVWLAAIAAIVLGGVAGLILDAGLWRPARKKSLGGVQIMIVSIGLSLALRYIIQFFYGGGTYQLPGAQADNIPWLSPINLTYIDLISMAISIVVIILVACGLLYTKLGKATRAISDNTALAAASGINVNFVIRIVWIVAGVLAALSGILWAYFRPGVKWDMGTAMLLLVFASITLGGLGTAYGALVGSLIVGILVQVSTLWVPADMSYVAPLVIMIVTLLVRPQGILGRRERIG